MTKKEREIFDGNNLIAKLCGGETEPPMTAGGAKYDQWSFPDSFPIQLTGRGYGRKTVIGSLDFHCKYDWLMIAVEELALYRFEDGDFLYPRTFGMFNEETGKYMVRFNRMPLFEDKHLLRALWMAVVNAAEMVNNNRQITRYAQEEVEGGFRHNQGEP
jgi:hypothetical protein